MTTIVANAHTAAATAHVQQGAFAQPNPEDTIGHLAKRVRFSGVTTHATVVQQEFMRRMGFVDRMFWQSDYDAHRGPMVATSKRREQQKRGISHLHVNEYPEPCRKRAKRVHVPMHSEDSTPLRLISLAPGPAHRRRD